MTNLLSIISSASPEALDQYAHLPRVVKDEAAAWFQMISDIEASGPSGMTPKSAIRNSKSAILKRHAVRLNKSVAQCTRKYYEWTNGTADYPAGDWRILVNRKKAGPAWYGSHARAASVEVLPRQFLEHWRQLCGQNQRGKCDPQYDALLRQLARWRKGDPTAAIPGYDQPPPNDDRGLHPRGWSYRNLMRHKPAKIEQTLVNLGVSAALKLLPPIPGTRVGVRFLEYVFFDDVFNDRGIILPGYRERLRLLQLGCHDYASAVYLKFGQRPEVPNPSDPSGRTVERLKESEMRFLVANFLEEFGYPEDYDMHLVLERGTATLRPADAQALYDLSGGRIKCCYTSMENGLVLIFEDRSTGNPRGKGPLESWHNLFHNECAGLLGQIGKDRDHSPAELYGRDRAAVALNTAAALLTPEQRSRLRLPFPSAQQALFETRAVVNIINARTRHNLEGFDDILLWRIKGTNMEWRPESELLNFPESLRSASAEALEYSTRKETPLERMAKLSAGVKFRKLQPGLIYSLFYEQSHLAVKTDGLQIEFTKDGRKYRFLPPGDSSLPPGEYLAYYNPQDLTRLHLTAGGAYKATWEIESRIRRGDSASLAAATARKQRQLNAHLTAVRRRHSDVIDQAEADLRNNETILQDAGLLPAPLTESANLTNTSLQGGGSRNSVASDPSPSARPEGQGRGQGEGCATQLQRAVTEHAAHKQSVRDHARAEERLSDLADEAFLSNIKPDLE